MDQKKPNEEIVFSITNNKDYPANTESYIKKERLSKRIINATNVVNDTDVVISVVDIPKNVDDSIGDEIEEVLNVIMNVSHVNILKTYTCFLLKSGKDKRMWFVQESEPWQVNDLRAIMKDFNDGIDPACICAILKQVLSALEALHQGGIAWRNFRPRNFLIQNDGRVIVNTMTLRTLTGAATRETLPFIAPEVIQSNESDMHDLKTDIWSFGVTVYFMATCIFPFNDEMLVTRKILDGTCIPDMTNVHEMFVEVINRCLDPDPKNRPTVGELIELPIFAEARGPEYIKEYLLQSHEADKPTNPIIEETAIQKPISKIKISENPIQVQRTQSDEVIAKPGPRIKISENTNTEQVSQPPMNGMRIRISENIEPETNNSDILVLYPKEQKEVSVPISNLPIETYCGETEEDYVLYFRSIPGTTLTLTVENCKTITIRGRFPPLEIDEDVEMITQVKSKFKKVVNFAFDIIPTEIEYERNLHASTFVVRIKKFRPRQLPEIVI